MWRQRDGLPRRRLMYLNDQGWLSVEAYVDTLNESWAAKHAGFKNPNVAAHRLRRRKHVAEAIAKAIAERAGATRSRIIEEVSRQQHQRRALGRERHSLNGISVGF